MRKIIAVLEGDGIGPEIMREAVKVLKVIERKYGHEFTLNFAPFGAGAYFSEGSAFPEKTKKICDEADGIMKGPVGLAVEDMKSIPQEHRPEIGAILPIRKRYETYANFRPIRLPKSLFSFSPLKPEVLKEGLDILMIRELLGGIYFGQKTEGESTGMNYAKDECIYTESEVKRIAVVAFDEARKRKSKMTDIHKSNVLATSRFWKEIVDNVAKDYPEIPYSSILVDNAAFQLVKNPSQFNGVMLLENMQGDILTDQAGGILGSLGLMPSACIGNKKSFVEPAHGSAPDIAGKGIANPYSMIGSVALLFEKCFSLGSEASVIWKALFNVFEKGYITPDLFSSGQDKNKVLSTSDFGDMVAEYIETAC